MFYGCNDLKKPPDLALDHFVLSLEEIPHPSGGPSKSKLSPTADDRRLAKMTPCKGAAEQPPATRLAPNRNDSDVGGEGDELSGQQADQEMLSERPYLRSHGDHGGGVFAVFVFGGGHHCGSRHIFVRPSHATIC